LLRFTALSVSAPFAGTRTFQVTRTPRISAAPRGSGAIAGSAPPVSRPAAASAAFGRTGAGAGTRSPAPSLGFAFSRVFAISTARFAPTDELWTAAGAEAGGSPSGVLVGAIVGAVAAAGFALLGFILWRRRQEETWFSDSNSARKSTNFSKWATPGAADELQELAPPMVTQTDVATFSDVLTYADDDRLDRMMRMDERESPFSLL
jgi:hypothetical protein